MSVSREQHGHHVDDVFSPLAAAVRPPDQLSLELNGPASSTRRLILPVPDLALGIEPKDGNGSGSPSEGQPPGNGGRHYRPADDGQNVHAATPHFLSTGTAAGSPEIGELRGRAGPLNPACIDVL